MSLWSRIERRLSDIAGELLLDEYRDQLYHARALIDAGEIQPAIDMLDALLRAVRVMLEKQGFTLHAAPEFIDGLTAPQGVLGSVAPTGAQQDDIRTGIDAARAHGRRDMGQAVVVLHGRVIAREDARGTDALIASNPAPGAILVKMAKPQQDRALDLPTIGAPTVQACAIVFCVAYVGLNLLADLLAIVGNPRLRHPK